MTSAKDGIPGIPGEDGSRLLQNVSLAGSDVVADLTLRDGNITAINAGSGEAEWVCLPPLADLHVHANRAFTPSDSRPKGLEDAARQVASVFASFTADDYHRHAEMLIRAAYAKGTTRIRTHADVSTSVGLDAVIGSLRAAQAWAGVVDVEVVAFASSSGDPAAAKGQELLREAVSIGAHYLGAAPAFCGDQAASIDAVLELAVELAVPVDLHLDEHLDPGNSYSEHLANATLERGLQGRVTLGHACAISALAPRDCARVVERLAEAEIAVIALPRTNLYLQDAGNHTPKLRGITAVRELIAAGVAVRFASDNVRDAFYPYGDADLLGVAMDGILATQLDETSTIVAMICDGRDSVAEGDNTNAVLLRGSGIDAVLASPPSERWLVDPAGLKRAGGKFVA
ncbi:MAG: amidohydrolase family protein [Woeseiaceae bacterium]|nr:amidohydrolase family protein [Woeseiaceae bacterium]